MKLTTIFKPCATLRGFLHGLSLPLLVSALILSACTPQKADSPKLYVMDCGELYFPDISGFSLTPADTDVRNLFVPCYLITHKGKALIWDLGLPINNVGKGDVSLDNGRGTTMKYKRSVMDQLADLNLTPDDIDYLALSHMHFDHTGAASVFTQSQWLVQKPEYDAAFSDSPPPAFVPALYASLKDNPTTLLSGDHDVFGDGRVKLLSTPGHTPGHQMLLVDLEKTGTLLLSGDLYHFQASRRLQSIPIFNTSAEASKRSMEHIEALVKQTGATLWIQHDLALAKTLEMSPHFYD